MLVDVATEMTQLVETTAAKLVLSDQGAVRVKPEPTKWSIQEILGHLIDSATNNHQRFVRAPEGGVLVFPKYQQEAWVSVQQYNESSWLELVELWRLYNRHLSHVIAGIAEKRLSIECRIGPYEPVSLHYRVEDYLVHMKHHLYQIEKLA